ALHDRITASNGARSSSARTVAGDRRVMLPAGLVIVSPVAANRSARAGLTRNVTSRPASSSRPPKYPPVAPAPTTRKRMDTPPARDTKSLSHRQTNHSALHRARDLAPGRRNASASVMSVRNRRLLTAVGDSMPNQDLFDRHAQRSLEDSH